ncbi:hypothetical protein LOTGIDRAFT_131803 [Lottia gigantea]|uniref:xanthine dehydrogenase n=1 Tax=Lottia gigantea TaxID=225164 RepID=V3ZK89_LOTGI|nr:hypothetical protein LOTGIDRAFT_131803 [Lottia gigantea]ESO84677.1 hypothetical protein LOTGIDRAFT_131803 [Lottia gigantea]
MDVPKHNTLIFYVNGVKIVEKDADPKWSLLFYLRTKLDLTGSKVVCNEGGCGACTVMISRYDPEQNTIIHYSVNACLTPVCSVHGLAVTTVEGIGSLKTRLHPVQEQIAKSHGSQCGFCTPGMVMSMYSLLRNNPQPSMKDIETYLEGNLCRCTGYRPILDGYRSYTKVRCTELIMHSMFNFQDVCSMGENCCKNKPHERDNQDVQMVSNSKCSRIAYDPTQEPIFPPDLKVQILCQEYILEFKNDEQTWYRPISLSQLLELKHQYPQAKLVVGNTEIGIEMRLKAMKYPVLNDVSNIPELIQVKETDTGIYVGSSVTLTKLEDVLRSKIETEAEERTRSLSAVIEMLKWFAGKQIKNTACIGGNIVTASPLSDLNPVLQCLNASLVLSSKDNPQREVKLDDKFFTAYRKTAIRDTEVLLSVFIPYSYKNEYVYSYKQATRKDDDLAIVNAGMRVVFDDNSNIIKELYLSYGGMAPTTLMATGTMNKLKGRKWESAIVPIACDYLAQDLPLQPDAPGGTIEFRRTLTTSFFFKFYLAVTQQLALQGIIESVPDREMSGIATPDYGSTEGSQFYDKVPAAQAVDNPIGRPIVHQAAYQQATGEAVYVNDMIPLKGELHVYPVYSHNAHAILESVDFKPALGIQGVVGYIDYKDVPGKNILEDMDEQLLATNEVTSVGCLIGGIVADSHETAVQASRLVKIDYKTDDIPVILTIQDAIENNSYWKEEPTVLSCGDVENGLGYCDQVLSGEVHCGPQRHFYLENQSARAVPKERGDIDVYSSAQYLDSIQSNIATCLDVPSNKVNCFTKRVGGGFGGKVCQNNYTACLAALTAKKYDKPVRCILEKQDDMVITGGRHPVYVKYTVGFSNEGRISVLNIDMYLNCGDSTSLSDTVKSNIIDRLDNAYKVANVKITSHLCKTNVRSNTVMRAAGCVQATYIMESIMQHVIDHLNAEPTRIRELNFYKEGERTPGNQIIEICLIENCWKECLKTSDYYNRKKQIDQFNSENRWRKRGISIVPMCLGSAFGLKMLNQGAALVNVYKDGSVLLAHGGVELGQGLHTKMIQVACATLGIPYDMIHIDQSATNIIPNASPTAASSSSDLFGMAVKIACEKIMKRLEPFINEKGTHWKDWVMQAYSERIGLSATGFYCHENLGYMAETDSYNKFFYYSFGAGCSEVEIDCLTGDHKLLRTDLVYDCGTSLNPAIDIGQIEGAFMHGYGYFMLERYKVSPTGDVLTRGPGEYKIPSLGNIPSVFNVSMLKDSPKRSTVYSSKCVGEPPLILSMSVFLATKQAIMASRQETGIEGYFRFDSPATPDNIRMACLDQFTKQVS